MKQHLSLILAAAFAVLSGAAQADDTLFLPVEDSFVISGMGVVAAGTIVRGSVKTGDKVELVGIGESAQATVLAIQLGLKTADTASAGAKVSVVLRGVEQDQVERGRVIGAPGILQAHSQITADVALAQSGGRARAAPDGYRPLLKIWTHSVSGTFQLGSQVELGSTVRVPIALEEPTVVQVGDSVDITEGGRSVGTGVVTSVDD